MDKFVYYIFRFFVGLLALIPFRGLYLFSDLVSFTLFHVIGYRKKVVYGNLRKSFPERSDKEIDRIAHRFYSHLADVLVEGFKGLTMPEAEIAKRFRILPSEYLEQVYKEGRSVIVVTGHYNNWEWPGAASGSQMFHKPVGFYRPMSNRYVDEFVRAKRVQGRAALVSINDTVAVFKTDWHEPAAFYMIADQSPLNIRLAYWVRFMHQDTATLHGPEKYARVYNMPVVYLDIRKTGRGRYEAAFLPLCTEPAKTRTGEITSMFMQLLEEKIREHPEFYLWSHRRWKHTRPVTPGAGTTGPQEVSKGAGQRPQAV